MDECISCDNKALYRCTPCIGSFCEEHKQLHERKKNKVHIFETIGIMLDSKQTAKIIENMLEKINVCKEFKERMMLETMTLIRKIEEMCTNCLNNAESKAQWYMDLIEKIQNPITMQDLKMIEDELEVLLSFTIPTQNIQEIIKYYDCQFFQESPKLNTERLKELKSMTVDNIKQALAQDFGLFLEAHTDSVICIAMTSDNKYLLSGSIDKTIRLWDLYDKRQECFLEGHSDCVRGIAVTKDNKYIVSA